MDTEAETTTAGASVAVPATSRLGAIVSFRGSDKDGDEEGLKGGEPLGFQDDGIRESRHDEDGEGPGVVAWSFQLSLFHDAFTAETSSA
jgi:hypothetical protein